jgi:hypothetical protein
MIEILFCVKKRSFNDTTFWGKPDALIYPEKVAFRNEKTNLKRPFGAVLKKY